MEQRLNVREEPAEAGDGPIRRAFVSFVVRDRSPAWRLAVSLAVFAAAVGIRFGLDPVVGGRSAWMPFYLATMIATLAAGLGAGALNVALSVAVVWGLFLWPHGRLATFQLPDLVLAAGFVIVAVGIASVAALARGAVRQLVAARRRLEEQARVVGLGHGFVRDMDGRVVSWSTGAERLYGWSTAEAVGQMAHRLLRTHYPVAQGTIEREVLARGEWQGELMQARKDGTGLAVASHWALQRADDGRPVAILEVNNDVTSLKRAEQAVRDQDEKLRFALQTAQMATWDWDLRTDAVTWSEAHYSLLGLPVSNPAASYRLWAERVHPDDLPAVEAAIVTARSGRTDFRATYRVVWPDGSLHWVEGRGRFFYGPDGEAYRGMGVMLDIDARKRLEADLREADRRKDEFLGMLAHELRNPLVPIRNAVHVLRLRGGDDPTVERARDMIDRQVAHMARLLDDLLDVARITRGKIGLVKEPVLVTDVVRQAIDSVRPHVERWAHTLTVSITPEPIRVEADAVRLVQVVANLLHNAAKYTEPGGCIAVTVEGRDEHVVIRVRDDGIGLDAALLPRIFDLFVQGTTDLDRAQGGLGIGLTLVRSLVALHGGWVEAYSDGPGRGSEFVVTLPVLPALALPAAGPMPVRTMTEGGRRVLIVEDSPDAAESFRMVLELDGHTVDVAPNAARALELAREQPPDVAFVDIGLPGMDGYQLVRRLRALPTLAGTMIIALSGYGRREDKDRATDAGFDHHLTKPVDPVVVSELLARGRPAPDDGGGSVVLH